MKIINLGYSCGIGLLLTACTLTNGLQGDEVLYTGIKHIAYDNVEKKQQVKKATKEEKEGTIRSVGNAANEIISLLSSPKAGIDEKELAKQRKKIEEQQRQKAKQNLQDVKTELEAVLAYAPNGAILGSSSWRYPFPVGLWVYNTFHKSQNKIGKWVSTTFGENPVLIQNANPSLRVKVATNTLQNYGYLNGEATYDLYSGKNKKAAKIGYDIHLGDLFHLDSISYVDFTPEQKTLLGMNAYATLLHRGDAFNAGELMKEQLRLENLFKNHGYYYYKSNMTTYLADTIQRPKWVQLRLKLLPNLPTKALRPWKIGKIHIFLNKETTKQAVKRTNTTVEDKLGDIYYTYSTPKIPVNSSVWHYALSLYPKEKYSLNHERETREKLQSMGIFSAVDFEFVPKDTTANCDTLDLHIRAVMDKAYDGVFEMNTKYKDVGQLGPGVTFSLNKRNAFRAGETVKFKIKGSYEWQVGKMLTEQLETQPNSYEVGTELSFDFPRLLFPALPKSFVKVPASTMFSLNANWLNRATYYSMVNLGLNTTYKWQKKATQKHELTLFALDYYKLLSSTPVFKQILQDNPALANSMSNQFVPSVSYTFTSTSRPTARNARFLQLSFKQAGNITSALYLLSGNGWNTKDKPLLGTSFAQFMKATAEVRENFKLNSYLHLATRAFAGVVYAYGNSSYAPYNEEFYIGGANSIRAFAPRSIGPGSFKSPNSKYSYLLQTGNTKLELNAELRFPLLGELSGACFVDAGNVWNLHQDDAEQGGELSWKGLKNMAVGTGFGLRYDIAFLVLRLDLGVGLHLPYDTGKKSWLNVPSLSKALLLNFAIGYPF